VATRTNIAERLSHVFARLEKAMAEAPANASLMSAWRSVLQPEDTDDIKLLGNIGTISSALMKMRAQVKASVAMMPSYKQSAEATVAQIRPLLLFSNMAAAASNVSAHCTAVQHGALGMIGLALQLEFSEPRLEPADSEEISKALLEVKELLSDATVALDLRHDLMMQIDQMLFWLSDLDIASSSELYERVGAATFTAALIKENDRSGDPESAAQSIWTKVGGIATKMIPFMSTATKFVDGAAKLDSSVHHLLSLPPPT
jgi:hypothetical protein